MTDKLWIDGRYWTGDELMKQTEPLHVKGDLDLRGYGHPLPAWLIAGGTDSRGYSFVGMLVSGEWRIRAGCRDFSIQQANRHWGSGGQSDRPDCLALVQKIVAEINARAVADGVSAAEIAS